MNYDSDGWDDVAAAIESDSVDWVARQEEADRKAGDGNDRWEDQGCEEGGAP